MKLRASVSLSLLLAFPAVAQDEALEPAFPAAAELLADEPFRGSEGIAFNGAGDLFVTANKALWQVYPNGEVRHVVDLYSNLGLASIGKRDLLVADFGPTNAFQQDRNSDGIIWRITPEGERTGYATGIGDPNFILMRKDGSLLVTDDATADIYVVGAGSEPLLFSTAVNHPNGLALSDDESTLYVAQIFKSIRPVVPDDSLWSIPLEDGKPAGAARLVTRLGPYAANDGLAMDREGRVYVAANGKAGEIWRFDPKTEELVLIARNVYGAASIAFGEGGFDHSSIYVSTTFNGGRGGKIWRVPVGVEGQPVNRGLEGVEQSNTTELEVRYLANEGFLVEGGDRRVLVDALFGAGIGGYPVVPPGVRSQLESGAGEWGDIQVALATHYHGDHFDPKSVERFLEANPEAVFVSTPQAVEKLSGQLRSSERVRSVLPPEGASEHLEVNGIEIEVLNLHHGRLTPPVENLGFVVTLGDQRFLHLGDTEAKMEVFEPYLESLRDVDLALLPFWFLSSEWRAGMVRDLIQPHDIVVAHMPTPNAGAGHFGRWQSYENLVRVIESAFPRARLPKESGESYRFDDG